MTRKMGECIEKFRTTEVQNFRAGSDLVCYESNSYVARNLTVSLPRQETLFYSCVNPSYKAQHVPGTL